MVSGRGIRPDPEMIVAMKDFPQTPEGVGDSKKIKFVRSFIGLCSYYRRFVDKFAQIAKPLTDLTKKDVPFEIHVDACGYGLGALLIQRINEEERPLAYASRLMTASELNYSTTEQE